MKRFYLYTFVSFAIWTTLAVSLHYFSASPWGGPLVLSPDRLLPDALFIEWGLLAAICLVCGTIDLFLPRGIVQNSWRVAVLLFLVVYSVFGQFDRELVRWIGQHINLSFLDNYGGNRDLHTTLRLYSRDLLWTGIALALILSTPIPAIVAWRRSRKHDKPPLGWRFLTAATVLTVLLVTAHIWFRHSYKRWRRIRPAVVSIVHDAYRDMRGMNKPRHAQRAFADLNAIIHDDPELTHAADPPPKAAQYPLWHNDNLGDLDVQQFEALPLSERPDIVYVVVETWRGWNTGLVRDPSIQVGNPKLDPILRKYATVFPHTHSTGFPSVAGCMSMHLGIWEHPRKIFLTDYLHIRSIGFPEILRNFGYRTWALVAADPSFSNFTPWLRRWYQDFEFNPEVTADGPEVDRFIEKYKQTKGDSPRLMMMWTATTHPPYNVPESTGIPVADTSEARYRQAIRYSDKQLVRLLKFLRAQPDWDRTIVVFVGDHAQPTPEQWRMTDTIGPLTPGHTWTALAIMGGWPGLPEPGMYDFDVSHIDLAPTLLSMLNIKAWNAFIGDDLRDVIAQSKSTDPAERKKAKNRPVLAFHDGNIAWQQGNQRLIFRLNNDHMVHITFERDDPLQYGQLRTDGLIIDHKAPEGWPVDRWRDAIRAYIELLDENRLMPEPPPSDTTATRDN